MALKFLGYEVNETEFLNEEIISSWEKVYNENNGTVTPVQTTGDTLFYFKDSALGDNWVLGWVLDADKNLFQFGPVTKAFALVPEANTFRERFGIKIEKIEKPVIEVAYEYTPNKEDLEKEVITFKEVEVQKAGEGKDDLGRTYAEFKDAEGNVVLRLTLIEAKKEEEVKEEPKEETKDEVKKEVKEEEKKDILPTIYEFISDEKAFLDTAEYQYDNQVFVREKTEGEAEKDEKGRPTATFVNQTNGQKLILTLTEAKEEEPKKEDKPNEPVQFFIEVNGVKITKVDGHELPYDVELTEKDKEIIEIAKSYEENLKERVWESFEDEKLLVTDYLYSDNFLDENGNPIKAVVRSNVVFLQKDSGVLNGYSIEADKLSNRMLGAKITHLIEETIESLYGKKEAKEADNTPSEEVSE